MGTANYTRECGPDGNTIVHLHATNSWTTVYVNGQVIHDTNNDGTADLTTGPGVYSIEWYGPSTDGNGVQHPELPFIPLNPFPTILDIPALTDCGVPTTTAAPTTSEAPTESTALVPPSTIATITPQIDMDVDPCVTSTGCTTVAVGVPPTLPATGDSYIPEITAGLFLAAGAVLALVGRRRTVTS
jgi:LPXTG-motif cell wall-anchored protein